MNTYPPARPALVAELRKRVQPKQERLSVSLPSEMVTWVKATATAAGCPVSHVVELALRRMDGTKSQPLTVAAFLRERGWSERGNGVWVAPGSDHGS